VLDLEGRAAESGIVDQDVDPAEGLHGLVARAFNAPEIGDVGRDRDHAPLVLELGRGLFGELRVAVPDRDAGGVGSEKALGDRAAEALGPAGYHREPALQINLVGHMALFPSVAPAGAPPTDT